MIKLHTYAFTLFSLICTNTTFYGATMKETKSYGSWKSPISAQMASQGLLKFSEVAIVDNTVYWLEGRSSEQGRVALMAWNAQNGERELLPKEYSVRSRIHEYGGGALLVTQHAIYFTHDKDQQLYCLDQHNNVRQITHQPNTRFADGSLNIHDGSLFYVMEEHADTVINSIVKINPTTGSIEVVASGNDFYSNPRVSPDGKKLAYVTWNNPNMPWDGTELWEFDLASNTKKLVAGGVTESITDPKWTPHGDLYYVSDRSNWWNIYDAKNNQNLCPINGEFSLPQWAFALSLIGFSDNNMVCSYIQNGVSKCGIVKQNEPQNFDLPYTAIHRLAVDHDTMALIANAPTQPTSIVVYDLKAHTTQVIKRATTLVVDPSYISTPQSLAFPSTEGRIAYAFYYPPCNPNFQAPEGEMPPLLVKSHGGPTGHTTPLFSLDILYWTSRGFAVIDVNYGGSTGYGREYRDTLKGMWGIVDVDDCTNAALYCVEQGLADNDRLCITGGSAGGFTTLAALAFKDVFKVGANYFGLSDLEVFVHDTHKFEARYLDQLVGPYPQEKELYKQRSPVHHIHNIKSPVIIFQGDEDKIVPPSQSEIIYNSLIERGIPTAYLLYQGEQHGFRKAHNIARSLEAQLYFFSKVLNFALSEDIEPVNIMNFVDTKKT